MRVRPLLTLTGLILGSVVVAAPATHAAGTSYTWIGGSSSPTGDNTSWTDPLNWSPEGVPGDGDSVTVAPPTEDVCNAHVTLVPTGLELANLTLADSQHGDSVCDAGIDGGSIEVTGTFTWHDGLVSTPITLAPSATGTISPLSPTIQASAELDADLVDEGTLDVVDNAGGDPDHSLVLTAGTTLTVSPSAVLHASGGNDISSTSCCGDPARVVDAGTITADGDLAFDYVELDQDGVLGIDGADSEVTSWAAPTTAADGARYTGGGTYRVSGASIVDTLSGTQTVDAGTTFVLGGGTEPFADQPVPADGDEQLAGTFTLAGRGSFVWTGGHLDGDATVSTKGGVTIGGPAEPKYVDAPHGAPGSATFTVPTTITGGTAKNPNDIDLVDGSSLGLASRTDVGAGVVISHGRPVNTGTLTVDAATKNPTTFSSAGLVNRGSFTVASGVVRIDDDLQQKSGSTLVAGTAELVEGGSSSAVRVQGGTLGGAGTIKGDVVATGGQVSPGTASGRVGTLTVHGDYSQAKPAALVVDEGARSGDTLAVTGSAHVVGRVAVHNSYVPTGSASRTAITAHGLTGTPSCVSTSGSGTTGARARHWIAVTGTRALTLESKPGRRTGC
ncbi:MAG: hypothetical protein INR72_18580 [Williamsia herbipolensis]|nr:hypothetical protein [Williamsia herbipolensis]